MVLKRTFYFSANESFPLVGDNCIINGQHVTIIEMSSQQQTKLQTSDDFALDLSAKPQERNVNNNEEVEKEDTFPALKTCNPKQYYRDGDKGPQAADNKGFKRELATRLAKGIGESIRTHKTSAQFQDLALSVLEEVLESFLTKIEKEFMPAFGKFVSQLTKGARSNTQLNQEKVSTKSRNERSSKEDTTLKAEGKQVHTFLCYSHRILYKLLLLLLFCNYNYKRNNKQSYYYYFINTIKDVIRIVKIYKI